jgi:putative N6-adenine-specific DNA methylase
VDSSGALLHMRGYRQATARAPLRETLAAAMLLACGWDPAAALLDPFCGAGTIPIEAAWLRAGRAPGAARHFAVLDWPGFDARLWRRLVREAEPAAARAAPAAAGPIIGYDRDAGAIEAARANAERAGVADVVRFERRAVSALEAPAGPGWVVTNPPYGVRTGSAATLRDLYARFGQRLRQHCPGWRLALLSPGPQLEHSLALPFDPARSLPLVNGGLAVTLVQGQVPAPAPS